MQEGLAVLEISAEGKAVKGRVAVGAQVADGPVLVSPGAGQAGAGRAGRGAVAGRVHGVAGLALTWRPGRPLGLQSGPGPPVCAVCATMPGRSFVLSVSVASVSKADARWTRSWEGEVTTYYQHRYSHVAPALRASS